MNRTEYKLDNLAYKAYTEPLKLSTAGQHTILFRSSDKVGNSEAETTLKVTVDTTPPVTKATASAQLSNEDIEVSLSATDADSGVCGTYYRVVKEKATPGDFQSGTDLVIEAKEDGSADGNYTIQYYSVDMIGNKETVKELKVKMDTTVFLQLTKEGKQSVGKDHYTVEGKTEPGSKVTVNGEPVTLSADGSFSYRGEPQGRREQGHRPGDRPCGEHSQQDGGCDLQRARDGDGNADTHRGCGGDCGRRGSGRVPVDEEEEEEGIGSRQKGTNGFRGIGNAVQGTTLVVRCHPAPITR